MRWRARFCAQIEQKKQAYARRRQRWEGLMVRHLKRLVADPKLEKRVPPGSLDGFKRAVAEGKV